MKRVGLFAAVVCLSLPLTAAPRFPSLVEGYQHPKAGPSSTISNLSFSVGHLKMSFASGTASPVTVAGQQAAIFFTGDGTFTYTSDDPVERPIVTHNVKVDSHLKLDADAKSAVISGPVNEVLLYAGGVALPQIAAGSGAVSPDFAKHVQDFAADASTAGAAHGMILQNLGAPSAKYVRAEIRSGRDLVLYLFDEPESTEEGLYTLQHPGADEPEIKHLLFARVLSDVPIGRDRKTPAPQPYYLTAVDYTLVADGDNAKLDVTETIARNTRQAVRFNMNDVLFAGRGGGDIRRYHVLGVTDEQGHALPFDHHHGELIVGLEGLGGETVKLKFSIEGNFLYRPGGDAAWQLGTTAWFPQPDFGGQYFTVHSLVKVKKPFIALAPGTTVRRAEEGDYSVVENVIDKPVQFAVVHAGKYELYEEKRAGLTMRVASYAGKNERAAKKLSNLAYQIIDYYQTFLGPFPFDEFNIIQVNSYGFGQAPPATMFITNEAFSMLDTVDRLFSQGINERYAHEIAHQYWAHVVKMPSGEEQWLTEAFAEYSAALAIRKMFGEGKYNTLVQHWKARAKEYTESAPIPLANEITGNDRGRARTYLLYAKGPYLLYTLHKQLGEEQFLLFFKAYQANRRWKFGTTADIVSLLTLLTKKDQMPFFDKYYWGTAMPE
jgi:Peptidase family M1 domain